MNGGTDNSLILNTNGSSQRDNGGNVRGTEAVGLQIVRLAATQVASGAQVTIGGGQDNSVSGAQATVGGGDGNTASGANATVGGGLQNSARGLASAIAGGRGMTFSGSASGSFGFPGGNAGANNVTISTSDVSDFDNTDLRLADNDNGARQIRFCGACNTAAAFPNRANYTAFSPSRRGLISGISCRRLRVRPVSTLPAAVLRNSSRCLRLRSE